MAASRRRRRSSVAAAGGGGGRLLAPPRLPPVLLLLLLVLTAAPAAGRGLRQDVHPTVVGGQQAPNGRFTHHIGLRVPSPSRPGFPFRCGGSLIRPDVVLTAAHCVDERESDTVINATAGAWVTPYMPENFTTDGVTLGAARVVVNPGYNPNTVANDVALVFLKSCFDLTPGKIATVALATSGDVAAAQGSTWVIPGWGRTSQDANYQGYLGQLARTLQYGLVKPVLKKDCRKALGTTLTSSMACAAGLPSAVSGSTTPYQDSCSGDSGGGLVLNVGQASNPVLGAQTDDRVAAIVSWGYSCGVLPGVYTSVPVVTHWITKQLKAVAPPCNVARVPSRPG